MVELTKPSKKFPTTTVDMKNIVARYSKYSPLLDGEDEQEFTAFQLSCIHAIQPANAIEEVWVMDFINYTWESMRLRRMKVALIHSNRQKAVECLLYDHSSGFSLDESDKAEAWSKGDEDTVAHVNKFMKTHGLDDEAIVANALQLCIQDFERLDRLIASYDFRRDKVIQELDRRRELLARRAREVADNVQDAEYEDLQDAASQ